MRHGGGGRIARGILCRASDDPVGCLWVFDVVSKTKRFRLRSDGIRRPVGRGAGSPRAATRIPDRGHRLRSQRAAAFAMDGGLLTW